MKQIITTLAVLLFTVSSFAQTTDTILQELKLNSVWQNTYLYLINRGSDCKATSQLTKAWNQSLSQWTNSNRVSYTYNNAGRLIHSFSEYWNNAENKWENDVQSILTYSDDGLFYNSIVQIWDKTTQTWVNYVKNTNGTNSLGQFIYNEFASYGNNEWMKISRLVQDYDNKNRSKKSVNYKWVNDSWLYSYKRETSYTNDGTKGYSYSYNWVDTDKEWVAYLRSGNTYIPKTLTIIDYKSESYSGSWVNSSKGRNYFNADSQVTRSVIQSWDAINSKWQNSFRGSYRYYPDGSLQGYNNEFWNSAIGDWDFGVRYSFSHNGCVLSASLQSAEDKTDYGISYNELKKLGEQKNISVQQLMRSLYSNGRDFSIPLENSLQNKQAQNYLLNIKIIPSNQIAQQQQAKDVSNISVQQNTISIVPNPAKSYVIIHSSQMINNGSFQLYDMQGKLLFTSRLENVKEQKIILPSLSKGVYNASLINGNETENKLLYIE